ncbi:MAG: SIS domain-containing protein [Candidatus Nanoarchaeia archaeon]
MNRAAEIIEQIKEEEQKGFFKRRKSEGKKPESMKTYILELPFHLQNAIKIVGEYSYLKKVNRIILCGVGPGEVASNLVKNYLSSDAKNLDVVDKHYIPENVDDKTLVFILSFSGDEEEPLLCYRNALRKGCKIVGLLGGGKIVESFKRNNVEHIILPQNIPVQIGVSYLTMAVLKYLENSRIIQNQSKSIEECLKALKNSEYQNMGKHLAGHAKDKTPLLYTSPKLWAVANSWKYLLNSMARTHSFWATYSELVYTELDGFSDNKKDYQVMFLRDQDDDKHTLKVINASKKVLKNHGQSLTELLVKGNNRLSKIFSSLAIGYWTAYYISEEKKNKDKKSLVNNYKTEFSESF